MRKYFIAYGHHSWPGAQDIDDSKWFSTKAEAVEWASQMYDPTAIYVKIDDEPWVYIEDEDGTLHFCDSRTEITTGEFNQILEKLTSIKVNPLTDSKDTITISKLDWYNNKYDKFFKEIKRILNFKWTEFGYVYTLDENHFMCSECGHIFEEVENYCPNCGACLNRDFDSEYFLEDNNGINYEVLGNNVHKFTYAEITKVRDTFLENLDKEKKKIIQDAFKQLREEGETI